MARIAVARHSFETGTFPPLCCKTGVHTDETARWRFGGVTGTIPLTGRAQRRISIAKTAMWVTGALAVVLLVVSLSSDGPSVLAIGACGLWLATSVASLALAPRARRVGDNTVELTNVHRRFVETIESAWAQQRPNP